MIFTQELNEKYRGIPGAEVPKRLDDIISVIEQDKLSYVPLHRIEAETALLKVHTIDYYETVLSNSRKCTIIPDLCFDTGLVDVALNAINTSITAARKGGFAIIRPPGHHAGKERYAGFCYFNNVAIAIENILHGDNVAIIDIDAHYGNGTHSIYAGREDILYASVHADTKKHYPNIEHSSDNSYLINVEPKQEDDASYIKHIKKLIDKVRTFEPEAIAISAGFDTYCKDPVEGFAIQDQHTYKKIGQMIKKLDIPAFAVLEGGYHQELGISARMFYEGLWSD